MGIEAYLLSSLHYYKMTKISFTVHSVENVRLLFALDQIQHNYEKQQFSDF